MTLIIVICGMAGMPGMQAAFAAGNDYPVSTGAANTGASAIEVTARTSPADQHGRYLYIVRFHEPSIATYRGGVEGLAPTNPRVTGQSRLNTRSQAATAYRAYLQSRHTEYLGRIGGTIDRGVDVHAQFLNVLNAAAIWLTPEEAGRVLALDFVRSLHIDEVDELLTDAGPQWIGAPAFWGGETTSGAANRGEGVVVGIMDSGVMHTHDSFAAVADDGYVHVNPYGAGNFVGDCDTHPDAVCNDKLIGSYMLHHLATTPEGTGSHGTHVAGTAGGNPVSASISGQTVDLSGVAPRANVINYKVCDLMPPEGVLCTAAARTEAVDLALDDQVDVLNHSIGDTTNPWTSSVSLAFLEAHEAGIYVAAAAGNSGPNASTLAGSLGPWNSTLANSSHNRAVGHGVAAAELTGLVGVPGSGPAIGADVTADVIDAAVVDPGNDLGCSPFPANAFDGAIALISRGDCNFSDKVAHAATAGAVGVIVYNNVGGPPIIMGGLEAIPTPAVMVDNADGAAVQAALAGSADPEGTIFAMTTVAYKEAWGDVMANLSSRGPNALDFLKPDVAAPGTSILAAVAGGGYNVLSGTSMASPHNAGAAALIMAEHPDWSPAQVMSAIALTAQPDAMLKEDGTTPADPFDRGSGRVDLAGAARVGFVLDESIENFENANPSGGGDPRTLNLPSMKDRQCAGTCSWQRTITSVLPVAQAYTATGVGAAGMTISIAPDSFTLNPGESLMLEITADVTGAAAEEWIFAEVVIEPVDNDVTGGASRGTTVLLDEDFEDTFPPAGWDRTVNANGLCPWLSTDDYDMGRGAALWLGVAEGLRGAGIDSDDCGASGQFHDSSLMTPSLDFTGVTDATLDFDMAILALSATTVTLDVSTDGGAGWTNLNTWAAEDVAFPDSSSEPFSYDLSAYDGEPDVIIRWRYQSGWDWWIYVDNVVVSGEGGGPADIPVARMPVVVQGVPEAPEIDVSVDSLSTQLEAGDNTTLNFDITNTGAAGTELIYSIDQAQPFSVVLGPASVSDVLVRGGGPSEPVELVIDGGFPPGQLVGVGAQQFLWFNQFTPGPLDLPFTLETLEIAFLTSSNAGASAQVGDSFDVYIWSAPDRDPQGSLTLLASVTGQTIAAMDAFNMVPLPGGVDIEASTGDVLIGVVNRTSRDPHFPAAGDSGVLSQQRSWVGFNFPGGIAGDPPDLSQAGQLGLIDGFLDGLNWHIRGFGTGGSACLQPSNVAWLDVNPTGGTLSGGDFDTIAVDIDATGLTPGMHEALLCIDSNDPDNPMVVLPVSVDVTGELPDALFRDCFEEDSPNACNWFKP